MIDLVVFLTAFVVIVFVYCFDSAFLLDVILRWNIGDLSRDLVLKAVCWITGCFCEFNEGKAGKKCSI